MDEDIVLGVKNKSIGTRNIAEKHIIAVYITFTSLAFL